MSKFLDTGGFHATTRMTRDPVYFSRWFVQQLKKFADQLGPDDTASVLPDDQQHQLVEGLRYLSDLDNCPFDLELLFVDEQANAATGEQTIQGFWYSVSFPWAETREFYHSVDGVVIQPFGKGELFMASGLRDLVFCLEVWLSDNLRKPDFQTATVVASKAGSQCRGVIEPQQHDQGRATIRTKHILEKLQLTRSTFHDLTQKAGLHNASHGYWYFDDIKKLAEENGLNCP